MFFGCTNLTSVTIPGSVTNLGEAAFAGCTHLTNVIIPNSIAKIGDWTFGLCSNLASVAIPDSITSIGGDAFYGCCRLTSLLIPNRVTSIGDNAFYDCTGLASVCFEGQAPTVVSTVFSSDNRVKACYLPGTAGWSNPFAGIPTAPWYPPNPVILNAGNGATVGVQGNGFGFTISCATNSPVVVEAATNLASPVWVPIQTNALVNGAFSFSDPQWLNYSGRFYRVRSPCKPYEDKGALRSTPGCLLATLRVALPAAGRRLWADGNR